MKKTAILLASVLPVLALGSCNKLSEGGPAAGGEVPGVKTGNVFFTFSGAHGTKAAIVDEDDSIGFAQVAVFEGDSPIGYGSGTIGNTAGIVEVSGVPLGVALDCYAVANCAGSIEGKTKAEIEAMEVCLKDFDCHRLPMSASGTKTFSDSDKTLSLSLRRASSKIELQKVTSAFTDPSLIASEARVTAIYVYNAPGKYRIGLTGPASQVYYHSGGYSSDDAAALGSAAPLVGETGLSGDISGNRSYTDGHDFYCCPDGGDGTWLTIEVTIGSRPYYYGVQMTGLEPNYKYVITNAVLTGRGNDNPPGIVKKGELSVTLDVAEWSTGFSGEVAF